MAVQRSNLFALRKGFMSHYLQAVPCCFWRKQHYLFIFEVKKTSSTYFLQFQASPTEPCTPSVLCFHTFLYPRGIRRADVYQQSYPPVLLLWCFAYFQKLNFFLLSPRLLLSSFLLFSMLCFFFLDLSHCQTASYRASVYTTLSLSPSVLLPLSFSRSLSTLTVSQS